MSARNPVAIIKDAVLSAYRRAYNIRHLRDTEQIVDYIYAEIDLVVSPKLLVAAVKAWIRDMVNDRLEQTDFFSKQPDLFRDLDFALAFHDKDGRSYQRALGDIDLSEALVLQQRKKANIDTAIRQHERFNTAFSFVRPLMETNPGWLWRDAVDYLESHGGFPVLK
jgi:hypothetical protein